MINKPAIIFKVVFPHPDGPRIEVRVHYYLQRSFLMMGQSILGNFVNFLLINESCPFKNSNNISSERYLVVKINIIPGRIYIIPIAPVMSFLPEVAN